MKKLLACWLAALLFAVFTGAAAEAQSLEELIVGVVREEQPQSQTVEIPNVNEMMGVRGVSQGLVDAGGILRGEAFLYEFENRDARVAAAWRLDAALTMRGFTPGAFAFEGASYTLYSTTAGGVLLMDGVTETASVVVLAGDFRQEGETPRIPAELTMTLDGGGYRAYSLADESLDGDGLLLTYQAQEPRGDGYDAVQICFPQADAARKAVLRAVYVPEE